jgi:hypothetical protein
MTRAIKPSDERALTGDQNIGDVIRAEAAGAWVDRANCRPGRPDQPRAGFGVLVKSLRAAPIRTDTMASPAATAVDLVRTTTSAALRSQPRASAPPPRLTHWKYHIVDGWRIDIRRAPPRALERLSGPSRSVTGGIAEGLPRAGERPSGRRGIDRQRSVRPDGRCASQSTVELNAAASRRHPR